MSIGILPNVNSIKLNRDAKQGTSVFPHHKVDEQPKKNEKSFQNGTSEDKGAVAIKKTVPQLEYVSQDSVPSSLPKRVRYW